MSNVGSLGAALSGVIVSTSVVIVLLLYSGTWIVSEEFNFFMYFISLILYIWFQRWWDEKLWGNTASFDELEIKSSNSFKREFISGRLRMISCFSIFPDCFVISNFNIYITNFKKMRFFKTPISENIQYCASE